MPVFEYDGKKYNVREEHIDNFMKDFPNAISVIERDGKKYRVKSSDYKTFMSDRANNDEHRPTDVATSQGVDNPVQQEESYQPTPEERQQFSDRMNRMSESLRQTTESFNQRMDNIREYGSHFGRGNTVEGNMRFNAETGKMEREYLTPAGNRYTDKAVADAESFRFRQAADMTVAGQKRKANQRLQELQAKAEARKIALANDTADKIASEVEEAKKGGFLSEIKYYAGMALGQQTHPFASDANINIESDPEYRALQAAIHQTEEQIATLERQEDREKGKNAGFWRGFSDIVGNSRTWDFGYGDLMDASTMLSVINDNTTINNEAKDAEQEMLRSVYENEQTQQQYGGNDNFWYRAGVMTGYMPAFMLDFVLTGGGFDGVTLFTKGGARAATKAIGKEAVSKIAEQGFKSYVKKNGLRGFGNYAANWTIKALGTTADDLLIRAPFMTNTVQIGKTTSDIIDRKLGDVVINEDGTFDFSNDATWSDAIWQGEANAIIENYSEMFGAHLDPVMSLGNMSKLANIVGAKRLGNVLAKADAGALNGIMGQTQELFNKMGVSDYFGEVAEEYYGQLWRTMLNLDDAYQTNLDGSRTNLLATGQFHGDIWGGMALSMGLMGAGKHTLNAANYASMKHGVNKADARVAEMLGTEIWEPLKATIDLTTNDNIGEVAELVYNDVDFTNDEKAAVLEYMERSMYLRGFNLASVANSRNGKQDEDVQQANESYLDGYSIDGPQEMNDAKNLYEYHRKHVGDLVDGDMMTLIDTNPVAALEFVGSNEEWSDDERTSVVDYINAKQVYDGMIQRIRNDIDGRVEQSNAMIESRVHRSNGMIQPATMKDDRKVYVISGDLVQYSDGTGIDNSASDGSIIVRDAETGALEQIAPDAILNIDGLQDPTEQKQIAEQQIVQQFAQEAANNIDGVASFNPGDTYTIAGEQGEMSIQITANEAGIVDNGDGTVNATDGNNVFPIPKEVIQQQVDAANLARVAEYERARAEENLMVKDAEREAQRPTFALNDTLTLLDENGNPVRGSITADVDADGKYEVYTENPINGQRVNLFTREELDNILSEHNGQQIMRSKSSTEESQPPQSAFERIPKDEQGNPLYEQADSDTAWDAIVEQTEGNEDMAQTVANGMVADKEAALKKAEKAKSKGGATIAEKIAAEKERAANIAAAKQELDLWKKIAGVSARRKTEIETERRRQAEETAAARRAEEERLRAEREEAERIEREALNGVPDFVHDNPKDARARGYRRVSGHKVDRQEPLQPVQGKAVSVKFSNDAISDGRVAIIDASQLQPSHIQGQRNPQHFIDEAQPKERNDQASVVSATKIANAIRPEEITSSVTAYTGAPTVNARGEVIQGNNRGFSLRLMWDNYKEQAEQYRQYLKDNAAEFGLTAEDIDSVQNPVLVNMLDVDDDTAITLGQYVAQDTESGGVERIKPKNTLQKMGANMRSFANMLLQSPDEETSFAGLVDRNGADVLKWMNTQGFITATQFKSAFDSKGNLTAEAKNDLRGIMYNSIFQGGSTMLEEMFNAMPAKAQKAILSTAFRDYDSPNAERMVGEIQNSIRAYYALSQDKQFSEATNFKDARMAVESWKIQYQIDDATGENYLPAENFSNFALHLATIYKGETQSLIQGTFNKLYDLIQGTQEENLFEKPDNTPRTLAQAINETLNFEYDGQQRSDVLAGDSSAVAGGEQRSEQSSDAGERVKSGAGTADDRAGLDGGREQGEINTTLGEQLQTAESETDTNPTDAQKVAGNYKKGHIQVGTFNVTIENPKGSVRSGVDANGKKWQTTMNNTYGYIRGTEGVDGDHIDVFLSDDIDGWDGRRVFVVDQYNTDGTFDEHKVMLGFNSEEDATAAYMSNYEPSWADEHKTVCSSVIIDEFERWIESSHRKTKAFADYKSVKRESDSEDVVPIGKGAFGDIYDQFRGKPQEAIRHLMRVQGGEALGALHHKDIGEIDLVWGEEGTGKSDGYGLSKLIKYHPEVVENLQEILDDMHIVSRSENRIKLESDTHQASIRLTWDNQEKKWLLTAFEKKEASEPIDKTTNTDDNPAEDLRGDTALSQNSNASDDKGTTISPNINGADKKTDGYTVEKRFHKKNNTDIFAVKFTEQMSREDFLELKKRVKDFGGYYSSFGKGGFIFDAEADANRFAQAVLDKSGESLDDAAPLSLNDIAEVQDAYSAQTESTDDIQALETAYADAYRKFITDNTAQSKDEARRLALDLGAAIRKNLRSEKVKFMDAQNTAIQRLKEIRSNVKAKMSSQSSTEESAPLADTKQESAPKNEGAFGLVSDERMEELREQLRKKMLGQLNAGFDPEILSIGLQLTAGHIDRGLKKFADYAKQMIDDFGDVIRPYLKAFYNGARDLPEVVSTGLAGEMTPYDEVSRFDIANFDKSDSDPFATAEMVVAEQEKQTQAQTAKQQIIDQRNTERRKENEQTTADTLALAEKAETVASEAETLAETATDEREINRAVEQIDETLDQINSQLALLGFYEYDEDDSKFHESYGYMLTAEKKAVKDATNLAKRLADDLGIKMDKITGSTTPLGRKKSKEGTAVRANIAPAGGDITITLPLLQGRELKMYIGIAPTAAKREENYRRARHGDNLYVDSIMYRIEEPAATGRDKYGINRWVVRPEETTYDYMLQLLRGEARNFLPQRPTMEVEQEQAWRDMLAMAERGESPYTVTPEVEAALAKERGAEDIFQQAARIAKEEEKKRTKRNSKKKSVSSQVELSDLFGGFTETETEKSDDNDIRRNDAVRTERLSADGRGHEQGLSERSEIGSESQQQKGGRTDGRGKDSSSEQHRAVRPRLSDAVTNPKNTSNNHSERGVDHAPTSVDARIDANIKAIELAQQLIENGDKATPEQMNVLRKFSGWGGLGKAFSDTAHSAKLQELLGKEGYDAATMSANSSYYTPAYVVDTLWDIAQQLGFEGGRILEGSAGIGNILGQMPTSISQRSDIQAVEIDPTSGGILSLLYPDAQVDIQGFEQTRIQNGSVDLAITNVPFVTGLRVNDTTSDKDLSRKFHNIHDFCIAKNVRKLRPGGIGIFITSNGTLDSSKKLRDWVVNEGSSDFIGAFRMNNKTFGGTVVTSDIIVIRKRVNGRRSSQAIDVSTVSGVRTAEFDTGETRKVKGQQVPVVKNLSMDYNKYFIEHPENMAGEMAFAFEHGDTFRPTSKGLYPTRDTDQNRMLSTFVQSFAAEQETAEETSTESDSNYVADVSADGRRLGELYEKDGQLVVAGFGGYYPLEVNSNKVKGHTKVECFKAYSAIKEALADVMEYQTNNEGDAGLKPLLDRLNKAYDAFVKTYGHFNKNTAISFLRNDVDFPNVFSLEKYEETGDKKGNRVQNFGKTDVFIRRVVEKEKEPTPTNVKDGIIASVFKYGRIDTAYIAEQLGESEDAIRRDIIENGYGFEDPTTRQIELSYQYLSGNVREKLRQAQDNNDNGEYDKNIKALEEVVPMDIPAHLIDFTLGSSWINPKMYDEYVKDRTGVDVKFTAVGGTWFMDAPAEWMLNSEKNRSMGVFSTMLHRNILGHTLIEAAMQNKTITVSQTRRRYDGTTETITDKDATQACAVKIDEIRGDFKDWARQKMQSDPELSALIEHEYNDMFNNYVPMSIPDEFVPEYFGGASHKFKMRPHQGRAIVRGTMQPLLLAHEVGTGKTFTLISTAMEMRRLGTARKPMIVVQNATVGQFVASAKELYPNAKILTLEEADRSAEGRKNFYAKIRYNDWDMIVVPQSTFEFIPDSEERQMAYIQSKIEEKMLVLDQMKDADPRNNSAIARQAKQEVEKLRDELAELTEQVSTKRSAAAEKKRAVSMQNAEVQARELLDRRTDDIENFDDMGIDALLVDEAHEYKHLGFATAMQRGVKGVDPSPSKKSQGVYLKAQAVLEKNNGRNVVFATGTPISNTAAEIWTFMRYLMPEDSMKEYGIYYFDDFVRNFGNIQQMLEFTTSGKFKESNRFAGYVNLPELVRIWSGVSDTVLTKEAGGVNDKIPDIESGKAQDIYLPQTRAMRGIMKFVKAQLDEYEKMSGKEKKENSHIPLTMYGIAKAAAVDARLVVNEAEDDPNSKTNEAVRQTLRSLKETAKYKGTVAIFADNYQNKASGFNIYDDIREKLIAGGVPADEVVVIRSGMTIKKKLEIFDKVNSGQIRVVLGSTFTLGTGVNIQERLHTLIHLDAPNRPMDYTQRNGRILRQGNLHKAMGLPVRVLRFGVEDSLDVTAYQRLKTKGAIADSIMNGKQMMLNSMTNRVLEEEEDVFGDTVAQLSGSEYAMLKNNAEKNVRKFESRKKQWEAHQTYIHNAKPRLTGQITEAEKRAGRNREFLRTVQSAFPDGKFNEITIGKHTFATVEEAADFIKDHNKSILDATKKMKETANISDTQTRELTISVGGFTFKVRTELSKDMAKNGGGLWVSEVHRKMTYSCPELGLEDVPVHQSLLRNAVDDIVQNIITGKDFSERIEAAENKAAHDRAELKQLISSEGVPFEYEDELSQAREQLREYSELMKKEMAEKEAKYAEMDATVETADVSSDLNDDDDVLMRDNELNAELQQQTMDADKHRQVARREMAERVRDLAKNLNLDNVDVVTRVGGLQGKKATAKGFYTKSTGKITVVIPNNTSVADVQRTLLHEAVAHYGLRQMFGEQFDTFLDNVFNNADKEVRGRIVDMAAKNGWDFRKATEEYLAHLAENTEFEQAKKSSWWQKVKDFFSDMLRKIGFADLNGTITDNELRYILWRSYENLKEGKHSNVLSEAADVAKQYELNVGEFDPENDILRRDGDPEIHSRALARDAYERRVKSGMFQSRESIQDSMLGLKEAMLAILGKKTNIEDVDGFENAYLGENRLSSVNKAEADAFAHILFKPMLDEVARLAPTEREREELTDYMMAKHGLERNRVMAERDARKTIDDGSSRSFDELLDAYRKTDYAGLTALTGFEKVDEAEAEAEQMVADFESSRETDELWDKVNAVSKAILQKSYECGMMSKQTFDEVSDMYEFYIPLRGFDEKTSAEAYAYLSHKQSAFNAPIKKAQGRKSKADDPFANLQSMAESAIVQGNRNRLVKQKFLNFVLNHPSDLVSVNDLWLQYNDVADEWRPVFPDNIDINDTPDEIEQKMQDFEAKMSSLAEADPDTYKRGRDAVNIPYRVVESRDLRQHQVIVKRNGRDYLLTINGNPRVAQALNGQTNPDNDTSGAIGAVLRAGEKINRQLSAFYTTRNPDFIVSNFVRDLLYSNAMTWVKESPNYALRYHRNYITKANPAKMKSLLARYRKGQLDMSDATDVMFHQFMMNGGETGYANVRDIEQHKNDIRKELKKANGRIKIARAWDLLGEQFDELNRAIENCARFAAFITSREMGRSLDRAIYDAKEISVNFNKKGSGAKFYDANGQSVAGNASALVSGLGRSGFVFWNAAIQGTTNFGRQFKRHPAKAYAGAAALFLLGAVVAYMGCDDDDDDKNAYYNLPEYVRRSNLLFSVGDYWISIPLPIEFRAFYGMGELMTSLFSGKEHLTDGEVASAIAGQATQILPIDFLEGGGGLNSFVPSAVKPLWEAYVIEKGWTGMPLYKDTPYNKDMPEWTKAYSSANKYIVGIANALNESTGGDRYTKGAIDLNPAKIEYMLNGYFGGVFGTIDKLTKTAETIAGAREYDPRSVLLVNRLVKSGDERTEYRAVNKEYLRLKDEHDRIKQRLKHYEEDTDNGVFDYAEKIDFLYNSPEYERYEIFEDYRRDIDALYDELKEAVDDEERKDIEAELNEVKKEMISEMNLTRKRK